MKQLFQHFAPLRRLFFLILLGYVPFALYAQNDPIEQEPAEDDWSLPDWVTRSFNSGVIFYDFEYWDYPPQYTDIATMGYRWKDLNPEEGVYNWDLIQDDLDEYENIYMRIGFSDTIHVPQWIFDKYPGLKESAFFVDEYTDIFNEQSEGYFIPFWHEGVKYELNQFWIDFKAQNFQALPGMHHVYVPGAYTWGEYHRVEDEILESFGLTPETYVQHFKELIDIFANAFEGYEYKLVYTGGDILSRNPSEYWRNAVGRQPSQYVVEKGLGYRTGLLEKFNFVHTELPNYGHSLMVENNKNYLITDDFNPMVADTLRVTANENESFCYGSYPCDYYHVKMSVLKQLQMRHKYSYTNHYAFDIDDAIHNYFLLTAGKQYYDSPDAWCALREAKDVYQWWTNYPDRENFYFSNWERWLYQREVEPDGKTRTNYYIDNDPYFSSNGDGYEARSTNVAENQNYIYFNVDDKFMYEGPYQIQIKVTYLDNFEGLWELQYQSTSEVYTPLAVANENDNQWKTITLDIDDDYFANGQTGGNDFRLYNGGNHDLTVRFVRVVKTIDPATLTGLAPGKSYRDIKVYPNPAQEYLTVVLPMSVRSETVIIYDVWGREVKTENIAPQTQSLQVNLKEFAHGVYVLKLDDYSVKFIKR